jgi:peptidoglycan/xylan/chitin deacetylase (PgdA/CDA1 family)
VTGCPLANGCVLNMTYNLFLTFDCEDFINARSTLALYRILNLLHKSRLKALFFLTGHMAEKISTFPHTLRLLEDHEIGYHSSAHSVRPTIFEYTDVEEYEQAYLLSLKRETRHINPITGDCEGEGGITFLKNLFPKKKILSFRAPGLCWSPPHLEAMKKLGIRFDFSTTLSPKPIRYKGLVFYPLPVVINDLSSLDYWLLFRSLLRYQIAVCDIHPNSYVNLQYWDSIYFTGNPPRLQEVQARNRKEMNDTFYHFQLFLKRIHSLKTKGIIQVTPNLNYDKIETNVTDPSPSWAMDCYTNSITWAITSFFYKPKFLYSHFTRFFQR